MRRITALALGIAMSVAVATPSGAATGRHWTPVPITSTPHGYTASGVSCPTATFCIAVGATRRATIPFAESWDGATWTQMTLPALDATNVILGSVSCVSESFCVAVGNADTAMLIMMWDGANWTTAPSPATGSLNGVSCTSATFCIAVGPGPLERWDGASWQTVDQPAGGGALTSVSCTSPHTCLAVGAKSTGPIFAERVVDDHVTILAGPPLVGDVDSIGGVSCASARRCMAVGFTFDGDATRSATYEWNAGTWTSTEEVPITGYTSLLDGVSCLDAHECVAVGAGAQASDGGTSHFEIIKSWNGHVWHNDNVRKLHGAGLGGVSCAFDDACVAVGGLERPSTAFVPVSFTNAATAS